MAERAGLPLIIAGIVQDEEYFDRFVAPRIDAGRSQRSLGALAIDVRLVTERAAQLLAPVTKYIAHEPQEHPLLGVVVFSSFFAVIFTAWSLIEAAAPPRGLVKPFT